MSFAHAMHHPYPLASTTVLQVIPDLAAGGAERTVLEIAEALVAEGARPLVVSRGGRLVRELEALGGKLIEMDAASKNPVTIRSNARKLEAIIEQEKESRHRTRAVARASVVSVSCYPPHSYTIHYDVSRCLLREFSRQTQIQFCHGKRGSRDCKLQVDC